MQFISTIVLALAAAAAAMPSSGKAPRDIMASLKRDPTGQGFTHLGSDNVVRTFDRRLQVVDAAPLDSRAENWARTPEASILEEIKEAVVRSNQQIESRSSKPRDVLDGRQESCVSENCPNDEYCQGLSLYGYNCSSCYFVTAEIGNCQEF
ncbi:hypothetical protein VM1G_03578 [Cytospora mali]|uniref:Uncharacterized protein n=1 Tax=Cytospora mali TaxID=578113 RepID=A0A194VV80_CYTMA|nr:hypothetical protein VM1G_03578 [Valsa mali]